MTNRTVLIFGISLTVIFLSGIFVGLTSSVQELKSINPQLSDNIFNINSEDEELIYDFSNHINITNKSELIEKQIELINFVWNSENLPLHYPDLVEKNFNDSRFDNIKNLKQIDKISILMENNLHSYSYLFLPEESNGKLIIYHQGHSGGFINGKNVIEKFISSGFSVVAFSMPLHGLNNQPTIELENLGHVKFFKHNQFVLLDSNDFSSMKYFFSPLNVTLNHIDKNFSFDEYNMIGISGGGWVTTVYSALDNRIINSFSIADSLPFSLRNTVDDVGDYEQFNPKFYSIVNYLELYVMSSFGENQTHTQILNKYDPCCFSGNYQDSYPNLVSQSLSKIGSGNFELITDDTHSEHKISDYTLNLINKKLS